MPDNIFKGSYEGASSTGSGQQIHKTGEEWPSGMAVYRKKQGVCA